MLRQLAPVRKAVLAFVLPIVGAAGGFMLDGDLTGPEVVVAIGTGLVAGVAVYQVKND